MLAQACIEIPDVFIDFRKSRFCEYLMFHFIFSNEMNPILEGDNMPCVVFIRIVDGEYQIFIA